MNKERILRWIIYTTGIVCLFLFIAVRYLPMYNTLLREKVSYWDNTKYGELYYFSMIRYFREINLPPFSRKFEDSEKHASITDCDILTFGDSFFEFSRIKQFPEHIADDFGKKVHYVNNDFPLQYLADHNYHDTLPKLVIFERVERYIPVAFAKEHNISQSGSSKKTQAGSIIDYFATRVFQRKSEQLYDVMLKRSKFTTDVYSFISTLKFDLFGYISEKTPVYKIEKDGSWLFYHDQVNGERTSFYYQFTQEQIDSICNNMADLAIKLKEYYNMELVYLPLPARYTLYHTVLNQDEYNNLLPRLYEGLDKRGVKFIKLFDDFLNSGEFLYYRTDEHWNRNGLDIAYKKTINYIMKDPELNSYLKATPDSIRNSISQLP
jgi:hypothetical protein